MTYRILAQKPPTPLGTISGDGLGSLGNINQVAGRGLGAITDVVSSVIGFMTVAAGIWFLFQFVIGGFYWITSGGDKSKLHEARERLNNAFIGLIIVISGWAILALAGQFLNVDFIIENPDSFIEKLKIKQ